MRLAPSLFVGLSIRDSTAFVYIYDGFYGVEYHSVEQNEDSIEDTLIRWLTEYRNGTGCKFVMAGLCRGDLYGDLYRRLWFELDIVPCVVNAEGDTADEKACSAARKATQMLGLGQVVDVVRVPVGYRHEVEVDGNHKMTFCNLSDYKRYTIDWDRLLKLADLVKSNSLCITFFNSTPQGGGVALMRHALLRLFKLLGVDAHWFVMKPHPEVFKMTKQKFHNVLQGIETGKEAELTNEDKIRYNTWCKTNLYHYWWNNGNSPFRRSTLVVIDDPQPSGMIPYVKDAKNGTCKIAYRSHIEIRSDLTQQRGTVQHSTWKYLLSNVSQADYFVSHPVERFVPSDIEPSKVRWMPAATDPLDGLNKDLSDFDLEYYRAAFNRWCMDQLDRAVDFDRPYIVQVARFDPSKGIADVLEAFDKLHNVLGDECPQLVITGHGSIDDPQSTVIYKQVLSSIKERYSHVENLIFPVKIGPSDQVLNAILAKARVALQLSHREGFEIKVTEALMKGVPVVAYAAGGIPIQVMHGVNGYLVNIGDTTTVKDHLVDLLTDDDLYDRMSRQAHFCNCLQFLTPQNAVRWMELLLEAAGIPVPVPVPEKKDTVCV